VHGYGFPADGDPGGVVVTAPDGVHDVRIEYRGRAPLQAPVRDNAALIPVDDLPAGPATITWDGGEAPLKTP
jgi:hypothetical protein